MCPLFYDKNKQMMAMCTSKNMFKEELIQSVLGFKITVHLQTVQCINRTCEHLWETVEVSFRRTLQTVLKSLTLLSDKRVTNSVHTGMSQRGCHQICLSLSGFSFPKNRVLFLPFQRGEQRTLLERSTLHRRVHLQSL